MERQLKQEKDGKKENLWLGVCWWRMAEGSSGAGRAEAGGALETSGRGKSRRARQLQSSGGSYNYNHIVQTQGIWHTRLLFHSTDDSSLL